MAKYTKGETKEPKVGDLRVWWIPQIPMSAFRVPVKDIEQAKFTLVLLANYDIFQFENHVKPDYSNVGGLEVYVEDAGDGKPDWEEWEDEEGNDIDNIEGEK